MSQVSDEARKALMEDRLRLFYISERDLMGFIQGVIKMINLPEDAILWRAFFDPPRQGIGILISHPSFDIVPPGCSAPFHGPLGYEMVKPEDQPKQIQFREFF